MTRKTSITYRNEKITQLLLITTKMNRLIAIDDSGSTGGSTFYWSNVTSIIANASDQDKFMLWDSESKITTL
jgi:Mor family transcriptional regulator